MRRSLVLGLVAACNSGAADRSDQLALDAHVCVAQRQNCNQPLPDVAGAWTAHVRHTNYHGTSLGDLVLDVSFEAQSEPGCFLVTAEPPPTTTPLWPDPNGMWQVNDSNASHVAPGPNSSSIHGELCTTTSGVLTIVTESGYTSLHTAWERFEELSGTLQR